MMSSSIREFFHLEQYTEEKVEQVVHLRGVYNKTDDEISRDTGLPVEDVKKYYLILFRCGDIK